MTDQKAAYDATGERLAVDFKQLRADPAFAARRRQTDERPGLPCSMISPVCGACGREIDRTPEGWVHVS